MITPPASARPLPAGFKRDSVFAMGLELNMVHSQKGRPPLLFLHGLGGSCEDWYDVMPLLADRRDCLAVDWPGFGWSPKPDLPYGVYYFCRVLDEILPQLGMDRAQLVGHSMGGQVALHFAATRPAKVERLAAVCPAGGHAAVKPWQRLALALLAKADDTMRLAVNESLARRLAVLPFADRRAPATLQAAQRIAAQWRDQRSRRERALARSARSILATPLWRDLGAVDAPTLLVTASRDALTPTADTDRLAAALGDVRRVIIGRDHMLPYSQPRELAAALGRFFADAAPDCDV